MSVSPEAPEGGHGERTAGHEYSERLARLQASWWRRLLPVQAPYRWNIRRLRLGRTLDVGCGRGRVLSHLGGNSVGIDHNPEFISYCRSLGLQAYTVDEWEATAAARAGQFDALVMSHLIEHLDPPSADDIVARYLPYLTETGRVLFVTPQERGFRSDPTHVTFTDFEALHELARRHQLAVVRSYSFPLPRRFGPLFTYNEFNVLARRVPAEQIA